MENYLMLNGKRIDLTAEQIETLVGKKEKDPFERAGDKEAYYFTSWDGRIIATDERFTIDDDRCYAIANYCTDKELMEQRALHETLNRLLWRYSMQHGGRDTRTIYFIYFNANGDFWVDFSGDSKIEGTAYFATMETAKAAIEEIVKPFMEQHPEFRW